MAVVVIYGRQQYLKNRRNMTAEHATLEAFAAFVGMWGIIFFGVWAIPMENSTKIGLDVFITIAMLIFALAYFMYKGTIPLPNQELVDKVTFWLRIIASSLAVAIAFFINYISWETVTIEGVNVVTYDNLFSLYFGLTGVVMMIITIWGIRKDNPYKKTHSKDLEIYSPLHSMIVRVNKKILRKTALTLTAGTFVDKSLINFKKISRLFDQHSDKFRKEDLEMWIDIEEEIKSRNGFFLGKERQQWFDYLEAKYQNLKAKPK